MIIPFLNGLHTFRAAKMTWLLVFINAVIVVVTSGVAQQAQDSLETVINDDFFRESQGRMYALFIESHKLNYSEVLRDISDKAMQGDAEKLTLLGTMAIRDNRFLNEAPLADNYSDRVAFENWKKKITVVREIQSIHPSYVLGLSDSDVSIQKWVSYIFVHSGAVHFLGNMLFLIIFGCALEPIIGSLAFLVVFLCSGVFAAGSFILMTGSSAAPLVGASGAISGVMALFACLYWKRPVRFIYWLFLPFRGFAGYVYLPAWVLLFMWLGSDLAGYLGTLNEFGGIAYTAHLGGEFAGILVGIIVFALRFRDRRLDLLPGGEDPPVGKLIPFENYHRILTGQK